MNRQKKKILISVICGLLVIIAVFWFISQRQKEAGIYKIGAILPLTGSAAEFGEEEKRGIILAVEDINSQGGIGGHKVEVIYEDSKNSPKEAVTIFNKFLTKSSPPIIFTAMSSVGMALKPLVEKHKIVMVIIAAHPALTQEEGYVFRMLPTSSNQAKDLAALAVKKLKVKNASILFVNDDLGDSLKSEFTSSFKALDGNIVATETFEKEGFEFRPQITKIIAQKPEAIFLAGYGKSLGILIKQIREMGYKGLLLGSLELPYPDVLSIAGKAAEGAIVADVLIDKTNPNAKKFVERFNNRYKKDPTLDAYLSYDAIMMVAEAIKKKGYKSEAIRKGLLEIKDFAGITGKLSVMPNGDVAFSLGLKTIKDGEIIPYETQ